MKNLPIAFAVLLLCISRSAGASGTPLGSQMGKWALHGSRAQIVSRLYGRPKSAGTDLDIVQYRIGSSAPIVRYTIEQTKLMHLILVRDDFREFAHVHPRFSRGHFIVPITIAQGHRYYVYADSTPDGMPQQVFRFQIGAGTQPALLQTVLAPSARDAVVGPYNVRLSTTRLVANRPQTLHAVVSRNGVPAADLEPYLGAAAHVVMINTSDLTYFHIHPMDAASAAGMNMDHMKMAVPASLSGKMKLAVPPLGSHAAYKLWLQFKGGGTVYAAPFTIVAQ